MVGAHAKTGARYFSSPPHAGPCAAISQGTEMKYFALALVPLLYIAFMPPAFASQGGPAKAVYSSHPQPHQFAPSWGRRDGRVN